MNNNNTLFILAKYGLKVVDKSGIFESHMWLLNENEQHMKYVSIHKSKSDRAYRGGEIVEIRNATDDEIESHQELMIKQGKDFMATESGRKIIVFKWDKNWKEIWPKRAKTNPMAYKGLGFVNWPKNS